MILLFVSSRRSLARCSLKEDFLIEEIFSPPLIIGQVIVALTDSSSFSSIVELKSLLSDLETEIEAEGENLDFSILSSTKFRNLILLTENVILRLT